MLGTLLTDGAVKCLIKDQNLGLRGYFWELGTLRTRDCVKNFGVMNLLGLGSKLNLLGLRSKWMDKEESDDEGGCVNDGWGYLVCMSALMECDVRLVASDFCFGNECHW